MNRLGKQGVTHQQGRGTAFYAAVRAEGKFVPAQPGSNGIHSAESHDLTSAPTTTDAVSQTELRWEHAATQVSGCRVCSALMPVPDGSSDHTCGRCAQGEELLHLVTEFREEVSRLRSIRERKR